MRFKDKEIKKIRIIGGAGSGKTTLSKELGELFNLPVISIDHFAKKLKRKTSADSKQFVENIVGQDEWIIEGVQQTDCYEVTFTEADLIIFLDFSLLLRQKRLVKRYIELKGNKTKSKRTCTLKQLNLLLKWNRQFENNKKLLEKQLNQFHVRQLHVRNEKDVKRFLNEFEEKINGKEVNQMDLSKLNFFNRKEGEKYKYEYNYDEDYDYDYDYEYEEETLPIQKKEVVITPSIPVIKEEKPTHSRDKFDVLMAENEQLKKEAEEQNEYINKLMIIKKKSDLALEQLRDHASKTKESVTELRAQLVQSEDEKAQLKAEVARLQGLSKQAPQAKVVQETTTTETEQVDPDKLIILKHLKLNQENTKKLEERLEQAESLIEKLDDISKNNLVRKKSVKKK